ncbi:MAG TPA: UDP-glucose--hexose-1-phosphate uridylyltransferase [Bacilli bacterium]
MSANTDAAITGLVNFALRQGLAEQEDRDFCRNALYALLQLPPPVEEADDLFAGERAPHAMLQLLIADAEKRGLLPFPGVTGQDLLNAKMMGALLPRPSETIRTFWNIAEKSGIAAATSWFYQFCIDANYIRMDRIGRNIAWEHESAYGKLKITINLSKPEKDPAEIARLAKEKPASAYPKCLLCRQNEGYAGNAHHPARQNLRLIPLQLQGETWYFQFSPYVYYHEHSIVLSARHEPMRLTQTSFRRLLEFVEQFPHYFIGSNADLPIVGGSILTHDHYQAGRHHFPMDVAPVEERFIHPAFPGATLGILRWPMSVVRIAANDKEKACALAYHLLSCWRKYDDPAAQIAHQTVMNGEQIPHNTATPIVRKNESGKFEFDLVLRNNRCNGEHPEGIFHPHRHLHHIKKENIGLIEVMGLAVLPGRLQRELKAIAEILQAPEKWTGSIPDDDPLAKHAEWIDELLAAQTGPLSADQAMAVLKASVGEKFAAVLADAGVFKRTKTGKQAFMRFLESAGCQTVQASRES